MIARCRKGTARYFMRFPLDEKILKHGPYRYLTPALQSGNVTVKQDPFPIVLET